MDLELEPLYIEGEAPPLRHFEDLSPEEKITRMATELQRAYSLINDLRSALIGLLSRQGVVPSYAVAIFDKPYDPNVLNWKCQPNPNGN